MKRVLCKRCQAPLGVPGTMPAVKVGENQYQHQSCPSSSLVKDLHRMVGLE